MPWPWPSRTCSPSNRASGKASPGRFISAGNLTIIDKNGGLPSTSINIGLVPQRRLGVVILSNRCQQHATKVVRQILHARAQDPSEPSSEGAEPSPDVD
jgi:hypothetical protein